MDKPRAKNEKVFRREKEAYPTRAGEVWEETKGGGKQGRTERERLASLTAPSEFQRRQYLKKEEKGLWTMSRMDENIKKKGNGFIKIICGGLTSGGGYAEHFTGEHRGNY